METPQGKAKMAETHKVRWFVYAGGEKMPRESTMRGAWDGYDAECSCGWKSRTGGAVKRAVTDAVRSHKWDVANGFWNAEKAKGE